MMNPFKEKEEILYPGDREQVFLWTKKWGITDEQLTEAIIETGSVHTKVLKRHLVKKGLIFSIAAYIDRLTGKQGREQQV
jgi:hypothetical protein